MTPYFPTETIRQHVTELLRIYEKRRGRAISFPIDAHDVATRVFGLEVIYDTEGVLNTLGDGILGCTYPDGHPSPWVGRDRVIAVNLTPKGSFNPTTRNDNHTIAHECAGHYLLHFLKGIMGEQYRGARSCTAKRNPLEWQADFAGGELLMPHDKVAWILDGKQSPEIVNLEVYGTRFKEFFGANQMQMETRLHVLGYKLLNGRYEWANHSAPPSGAAVSSKESPRTRRDPKGSSERHSAPQVDPRMFAEFMKQFGAVNQLNNSLDWFALQDLFSPLNLRRTTPRQTPPRRPGKR